MKPGLRELVFAAVLMGIPLAAWRLDLRPRGLRNEEMQAKIKDRHVKLSRVQRLAHEIGDLKRENAGHEKAVTLLRSRLPDAKEIDEVVKEVWRVAQANKLKPKSVRIVALNPSKRLTPAGGPYGEQPILVQLQGDFLGFYSFLTAMETKSRIMRVRKMTLKKLKNLPEGHMFATVEIAVFFERNQEDA